MPILYIIIICGRVKFCISDASARAASDHVYITNLIFFDIHANLFDEYSCR